MYIYIYIHRERERVKYTHIYTHSPPRPLPQEDLHGYCCLGAGTKGEHVCQEGHRGELQTASDPANNDNKHNNDK